VRIRVRLALGGELTVNPVNQLLFHKVIIKV